MPPIVAAFIYLAGVVWLFRRLGIATGIDWNALLTAADLAAAVPGAIPGGRLRGVPGARAA